MTAKIYVSFENRRHKEPISCAPLAIEAEEMRSMLSTGEIDLNLPLTDQNIRWLQRWLPKYKNTNKYTVEIYEYSPEEMEKLRSPHTTNQAY